MTERIKLTEEHFIPCEDKQYGFSMLIRLPTTSYDEFKQLKQQILDDHKKAEKWNKVSNYDEIKTNDELIQENKQLKENKEQILKSWGLEMEERDNLKQKLEKMGKELQKRIDEETKHINHPKQIYRTVVHNCEYNLRVCEILKEILEEKE